MDRMHFGQHSSSQFNEALESIRNHLMEMGGLVEKQVCLLYTSPSPRDATLSRMPSSA